MYEYISVSIVQYIYITEEHSERTFQTTTATFLYRVKQTAVHISRYYRFLLYNLLIEI